jgi:hypothetical protein
VFKGLYYSKQYNPYHNSNGILLQKYKDEPKIHIGPKRLQIAKTFLKNTKTEESH